MAVDIYAPNAHDAISLEELALYQLIMGYRAEMGLAAVPLSRALSTTAGRHVVDTRENIWAENVTLPQGANLHSWSDAYYYDDHRTPQAMWDAPERLGTGYTSSGYEISAAGFGTIEGALEGWKGSPSHNAVLANSGIWADIEFLAIGVGVETSPGAGPYGGRIYHVWFGEAADPGVPPILGTDSADRIVGTAFNDEIYAGAGSDAIYGGAGSDVLFGGHGYDLIYGGEDRDVLYGGARNDVLHGDGSHDVLYGGEGNDVLYGGSMNDRLVGGPGSDVMFGGSGYDVFVFEDIPPSQYFTDLDVICKFVSGEDVIDLSLVNAVAGQPDTAFTFIGEREFTLEAGQLRQYARYVHGDIDGDGIADLRIFLDDAVVSAERTPGKLYGTLLSESDFIF